MVASANGVPTGKQNDGPFALSRATVEDMDELVNLEYECFPEYIQKVAMGVLDRERDLPKIRQKYIHEMTTDPSDIWIKVTEKATGRIVAASNYRIYLHGPPPDREMDSVPEWLEGEWRGKSEAFMHQAEKTRRGILKGQGFVYLHICFTSEAHRRRGAGSMMMQWGCDVADLLGLAGWIEASEEGNFLYKVHGFYDHSKIEGGMEGLEGVNMKRDAKAWAIQGGK